MNQPTRRKTYCRICEAACALIAETDDQGRTRLKPDKRHPYSQGYACAKGTRFGEMNNHPKRLKQPLKRNAMTGRLEPTTWEDAYGLIAERLGGIIQEHGPHSVAVYQGNPILFNALGLTSQLLLNRALATRNVYSSFSQDCNNKFTAARMMWGGELVHPIPDLREAQTAVFFGSNPAVSNGSFVNLEGGAFALDAFQKRGGKSFWIDPHHSESARRWGDHLAIKPGTDIFLLLALIHACGDLAVHNGQVQGLEKWIALAAEYPPERAAHLTGLDAGQIHALATELRTSQATTFHLSVGVNMGPFGTLAYVAMHALAHLTGNLDKPGGLLFHPLAAPLSGLLHKLGIGVDPEPSRIGGFTGVFDELPGGILADEILTPGDGQVRAMILTAGNPIRSIPGAQKVHQAMASLDFLVQIDVMTNATSAHADVVLPATTWLERWDAATTPATFTRASMVPYAGPVTKPPENVRGERRILADLSLAINRPLLRSRLLTKLWSRFPIDGLLSAVLPIVLWPFSLIKGARGLPAPTPKAGRFLRGKRTLTLWDNLLQDEPDRLSGFAHELSEHHDKLMLIGRRRKICHNSWLHGAKPDGGDQATAWVHPDDAQRLELEDGNTVEIRSSEAALSIPLEITDKAAPGCVVVPHGLKHININALFPSGPDHIERVSGNHHMTGIPVVVNRVQSMVS